MPNFIPEVKETAHDETDPFLAQLPERGFMLFVGDVTADKGAEVLLEAYTEMDTRVPLVFIGRPFLTGGAEHHPPNVFMLGRWPHDAVMQAWERCLFGLVPSIVAETFGIVALEAMSMGKPVIAARSGGLPDVVIDGETGVLVPPGNAQALRQAMQYLLDNLERRELMGQKARERAAEFQAATVVSHIEEVYQDLLGVRPIEARSLTGAGSR
jgi:glycosyltransferase involved in cell wall biosynthesis